MIPSWLARARAMPRAASNGAGSLFKKGHQGLQNRYGPKYTRAMLSAACIGFVFPLPGSSLLGIALVVGIAEVHRAMGSRDGFPETIANL